MRALFYIFGVGKLPQNQKRANLVERAFRSGVVTDRDLWRSPPADRDADRAVPDEKRRSALTSLPSTADAPPSRSPTAKPGRRRDGRLCGPTSEEPSRGGCIRKPHRVRQPVLGLAGSTICTPQGTTP